MGEEKRVPLIGAGSWTAAVVVATLAEAGCVKINTQTTLSEDFVEERSTVQTVDGSVRHYATPSLDGENLRVIVKRDEQCSTSVTPVYRKRAHHVRKIDDSSNHFLRPMYEALYGVCSLGAGAAFYFDADGLASGGGGGGGSGTSPSDYRSIGLVLGAAGLGLLTIATIDGIRLRDTDEDLGNVDHDPKVSEAACHGRVVANEKIALGAGSSVDWRMDGVTDSGGVVHFALRDIPEQAFDGNVLHLAIAVSGSSVPLSFSSDGWASKLLGMLAANPASRVSRDREASAVAVCDKRVAAARELQQHDMKTKPDDVVGSWNTAKAECVGHWGNDLDKELAQATSLARGVHLDADSLEFDAALAAVIGKNEVPVGELQRAEQHLKALGALTPPDPDLEKKTKRLEAARRRALDALVALANRHLARGELDAANSDLDAIGSISSADPRIEPIHRRVVAQQEAQARRDEEKRRQEEAKEEREAERKEGPFWHAQYVCNGNVLADTWKRGFSARDVQRKLCMNVAEPVRAECMAGPSNSYCEFIVTKVKCDGCRN